MATIWVAISLFLFDIAGLASHLRLKLCGEIVWAFKVKPVGNFLHAEICRRE